ncbi:hypothetical protein Dimus_006570 [Dionaea muscipula]
MKNTLKIFESLLFPHKNGSKVISVISALLFFLFVAYIAFLLISIYAQSSSSSSSRVLRFSSFRCSLINVTSTSTPQEITGLQHIVFGIGSAAKNWEHRKNYVEYWWRPNVTRGFVWLDKLMVNMINEEEDHDQSTSRNNMNYIYPIIKESSDTSRFTYTNTNGGGIRAALRMTRIVSEMVRMDLEDVRWFVLGDDDTVFFLDNLVRVLRRYDHDQMYYIGSNSETHLQDILFNYGMAFGGGGIAISYPLATAIEKMQDRCIERYPGLYGSDDRLHACLAELGVPLTREPGFHQMDIHGDVWGLLSAHPVAPIVTLHHLDVVKPIFPFLDKMKALNRLKIPENLDSAGLMQQSICYDASRNWTISVSWGYSVHIYPERVSPREMEKPLRTFRDWYKKDDPESFTFNTRDLPLDPCKGPFVYYVTFIALIPGKDSIGSEYVQFGYDRVSRDRCLQHVAANNNTIVVVDKVRVFNKPDPYLWDKAPRRKCCKVLASHEAQTMVVHIDTCKEDDRSIHHRIEIK